MFNFKQFNDLNTRVLKDMGVYSPEAVLAINMIVAHESKGGTYLKQVGSGIALGIIQMEGWVHDDTWKHCDNIQKYADKLAIKKNNNALEYDLRYSIFMARCRLIMDINPLPKTPEGMAEYLKVYWNSNKGAATPYKYLNDYNNWINN